MARRVTPQALLHRLAIAWIVVGVASAVGCTRTAEQGGAASAPRVVTTRSTGIPHGHEGQPLVVDYTTYAVRPFPDNLLAIDLTKPDGALKVVCEPHPNLRAVGIACCDVVNHSAQFADRKIVYSLLDDEVQPPSQRFRSVVTCEREFSVASSLQRVWGRRRLIPSRARTPPAASR